MAFFAHDADIAIEIGNLRQAVVEGDQVGEAIHRFQLTAPLQFFGERDAVDLHVAFVKLLHPGENSPVLLQNEIFGDDLSGDFDEAAVVQQKRAKDELLRFEIGGKTLVESNVGERRGHECGI